jgi:DnaJ-domain-containing protein 1
MKPSIKDATKDYNVLARDYKFLAKEYAALKKKVHELESEKQEMILMCKLNPTINDAWEQLQVAIKLAKNS